MEGDVPASWKEYAKQKGIDIDGFTPEQVHRQQVIHEMILTEFSYCQDLRLIIDEFANVLRTQFKGALNVEQMDIVFQNIEEILPVNLALAQDLEARRQESLVVERIGDIYKEYIPRMAVYTPYLCQFTKAQDMVIECDKPGSKFHAFLEDRHLNCAATNGLDLMSMLIKPCQRICKYPLLIRDLLKSTSEDSADIDDLLEAAEGFNLILDEMNDTKRRREMAVRARELTVLIEKGVEMGLARRKFIKEGDVVQFDGKKMLDRTLVLFGDFLVVVKKKNEKKYTLKLQFNLSEILVSEEPDSARILDAIKLIHGPNVYIFAFVDSDEKGEWLGELNYWIDICLEEQLREHKKLKRITIGPSTMSNFDVSMFSGEAFGSDDVRRKLEEKNGPKAIGSSPRNLPLPPAPNRGGSSSARTSRRNSLVRDEISGPVLVAATKETDDTKFIDLSGGEPRSVPARGKNLPPPPPRAGGRAPASTGGMSTRDKALPPPPPGGGGNNVNNNKGTGPPLAAPARRRAETEQPGAAPPRVGYDKPLPTPGGETGGDSTTDEPVSRRQSVGKGLASILNSLPSIPAWRSKSGSSASDAAPASEYGSTNLDSPRSARSLPPPPPGATPRRPTSTSSASGAMPSRTASPLPPTPPQTTSSQKGVSSASSSPLPPTPGKAGSGKALPPQPPGESSASGSSNNSTNNATLGKALPPQPPGAAESPASGSANNSGNKSTLGVSAGSGKALPPQPPGGGESPASVSSNNSANKTAAGAGKALPPQPPGAGDTTNNNPLPSLPPTPGAKALPPQPPPSSAKPTLSVPLSNKGIGKANKVGGGTGNNSSNNGALPALPTPPRGKTAGGSVSNRPTLPPTPDRSTKAASANPLPTPPKSPGRGPNPLQAPARGAPPPPPASAKPNPSTLPIPPTQQQQQQQQQQIIGVSGVGGVSGGGKLPPPPIDRSQKQPQNLHRRTNSSGSAPAMRRWNSSDSVGSEARGLSQVGHANRAVDAYGGGGGVQQQQRGHVRGASDGKSLPPPPGGALPATPAGPPPVPTIAKPKIGPPPPERDDSLSWAAQESATAGAPPPPSRPPPKRDVQAIGFGQRSLAVRNPRTGRVRSNSTGTNLTALEAARNGWREGVAPSGRVRRGIPIDPTTGKPPPPTNPPPSRTRAGTGNSIPTDPLAYGGRTGGPGLGLSMPKGQQGAGAGSGSGSGSGAGGMPVQSVNSGGTGRTGGPGLGLNMPNGQQGGAPNPPRGGPMPGSAPTTPMGGVGGLPPTPNNNNNNSNNNTYDNNNNNNNGGGRLPPTPTGEAVGAMPAQPAGQGGVAPWDRQRAGQRKRMIGSILNAQESERATVADRMKGFGFVERRTSVFVASRMAEPTAESTAADEDTPDGKVYAYDYLRTKPRILHLNLLPFYLSRAEFRSVFGVDKDTFRGLPSWKQEMLRKKHGLF